MNDRERTGGALARWIVAAVLAIAFVAVAFDNRDETEVGYVFGDVRAPLWVVLIAAGVAGILIGWLIKHRPRRD